MGKKSGARAIDKDDVCNNWSILFAISSLHFCLIITTRESNVLAPKQQM